VSQRIPPYLVPAPLDRRARRRRRIARQVLRAALFPFVVLRALLAWLASPCFLD
jgi:hypothetical protein